MANLRVGRCAEDLPAMGALHLHMLVDPYAAGGADGAGLGLGDTKPRLATWHLPRCGTRPRYRPARLSPPEHRAQPGHSAAARSKCVAAFLSSAAERGPASQAAHNPLSTAARIWLVNLRLQT